MSCDLSSLRPKTHLRRAVTSVDRTTREQLEDWMMSLEKERAKREDFPVFDEKEEEALSRDDVKWFQHLVEDCLGSTLFLPAEFSCLMRQQCSILKRYLVWMHNKNTIEIYMFWIVELSPNLSNWPKGGYHIRFVWKSWWAKYRSSSCFV